MQTFVIDLHVKRLIANIFIPLPETDLFISYQKLNFEALMFFTIGIEWIEGTPRIFNMKISSENYSPLPSILH